jgi:hypothetical protein
MLTSQYRHVALPHWISPFFVLFIPIGTFYLYRAYPKATKYTVAISLALAVIIQLELIAKIGKFQDYKSPFRDIAGWNEAMKIASQHLNELNSTNAALAVTNWSLASRAMIYSTQNVYLIDDRSDQFDIWQKGIPEGKDLIFINPKTFNKDINATYRCDSVTKLGEYNATLNGGVIDTFSYELCKKFAGKR